MRKADRRPARAYDARPCWRGSWPCGVQAGDAGGAAPPGRRRRPQRRRRRWRRRWGGGAAATAAASAGRGHADVREFCDARLSGAADLLDAARRIKTGSKLVAFLEYCGLEECAAAAPRSHAPRALARPAPRPHSGLRNTTRRSAAPGARPSWRRTASTSSTTFLALEGGPRPLGISHAAELAESTASEGKARATATATGRCRGTRHTTSTPSRPSSSRALDGPLLPEVDQARLQGLGQELHQEACAAARGTPPPHRTAPHRTHTHRTARIARTAPHRRSQPHPHGDRRPNAPPSPHPPPSSRPPPPSLPPHRDIAKKSASIKKGQGGGGTRRELGDAAHRGRGRLLRLRRRRRPSRKLRARAAAGDVVAAAALIEAEVEHAEQMVRLLGARRRWRASTPAPRRRVRRGGRPRARLARHEADAAPAQQACRGLANVSSGDEEWTGRPVPPPPRPAPAPRQRASRRLGCLGEGGRRRYTRSARPSDGQVQAALLEAHAPLVAARCARTRPCPAVPSRRSALANMAAATACNRRPRVRRRRRRHGRLTEHEGDVAIHNAAIACFNLAPTPTRAAPSPSRRRAIIAEASSDTMRAPRSSRTARGAPAGTPSASGSSPLPPPPRPLPHALLFRQRPRQHLVWGATCRQRTWRPAPPPALKVLHEYPGRRRRGAPRPRQRLSRRRKARPIPALPPSPGLAPTPTLTHPDRPAAPRPAARAAAPTLTRRAAAVRAGAARDLSRPRGSTGRARRSVRGPRLLRQPRRPADALSAPSSCSTPPPPPPSAASTITRGAAGATRTPHARRSPPPPLNPSFKSRSNPDPPPVRAHPTPDPAPPFRARAQVIEQACNLPTTSRAATGRGARSSRRAASAPSSRRARTSSPPACSASAAARSPRSRAAPRVPRVARANAIGAVCHGLDKHPRWQSCRWRAASSSPSRRGRHAVRQGAPALRRRQRDEARAQDAPREQRTREAAQSTRRTWREAARRWRWAAAAAATSWSRRPPRRARRRGAGAAPAADGVKGSVMRSPSPALCSTMSGHALWTLVLRCTAVYL